MICIRTYARVRKDTYNICIRTNRIYHEDTRAFELGHACMWRKDYMYSFVRTTSVVRKDIYISA